MADIEQSLQDIQQERSRLLTAKENLKTAITGKGVTVSDDAKLDEYYTYVNGIQQGVEGGIDVSATTAVESDVLSTAKFYKADGSFVSGNIQTVSPRLSNNKFTVKKGYVSSDVEMTVPTVTPSLDKNVFTVGKGYVEEQKTLTVPESTITETEDKVTVGVGYVGESKEYSLGTDNVAGVLVDDGNGGLMVQKLSFDGTIASDSGEPLTADNFYMFNTGKDEPDYGGSVDLSFVTAEADQILSGYVGSDKDGNPVNGTIATVTPSLSGNKFTVGKGYVPENKELTVAEAKAPTVSGNTVTIHPGYVPEEKTVETEGGGGSMEIYKCASVDSVNKTWSGYISVLTDGAYTFADTVTTGLTYSAIIPIVGKIYSSDALIVVDRLFDGTLIPLEGLVFYVPLTEAKTVAETGQAITLTGEPSYGVVDGIKCMTGDYAGLYMSENDYKIAIGSKGTMSCWIKSNSYNTQCIICILGNNGSSRGWNLYLRSGRFSIGRNGEEIHLTSYQTGKWYHVVAVADGSESRLYLNGTCTATEQYEINCTDQNVSVGNFKNIEEYFKGSIAAVRIYNRVLTDEEIVKLSQEFTPTA